MKITQICVYNFLVFNGKYCFSFDKNISFLFGRNGSGKSSVYDAIVYGLYGKLSKDRNISLGDLLNDKAIVKKGEESFYVELDITSTLGRFLIHRGRIGSKTNFYVKVFNTETEEWEDFDKHYKDISDLQNWVEQNLLHNVSFDLFVITHKYHTDLKKIADMTSNELVSLFDNVLGLSVLDVFGKHIHKTFGELSNEVIRKGQEIVSLKDEKARILLEAQQQQQASEQEIAQIEEEISQIQIKLNELQVVLQEKQNNYNKYSEEVNKIFNEYQQITQEKYKYESELNQYNKDIQKIKQTQGYGICPVCKQPIDKELLNQHITTIETSKQQIEQKVKELQSIIAQKSQMYESMKKELDQMNQELYTIQNTKSQYEFTIKSLRDKQTFLRNKIQTTYTSLLEKINEKGKQTAEEYGEVYKQYNIYKWLDGYFSRGKLKYTIYKNIIETELNAILEEIATHVLNKYQIIFEVIEKQVAKKTALKVELSIIKKDTNKKVSVASQSSGEKRMIDLVLFIAFLLLLQKHDKFLGIVLIDEFVDNLDEYNKVRIFNILYKILTEGSLQSFIISHTLKDYIYENDYISNANVFEIDKITSNL